MTVKCTVLYPNESDATFDLSYYLSKHMPLVASKWGPFGLKDWSVVKFENGPDGSKPQFSIQATLTWDKVDSVRTALEKDSKDIFEDVPKFSNKGPVFLIGDEVGTS